MLAVHAFRIGIGILVAGIFVIPIHDPERPIGADLLADRHEPAIIGPHQVPDKRGFEARSVGDQTVLMHGIVMDVAHENGAAIFLRVLIPLINLDAGVSRHVMLVIDNRRQELIGVRMRRRAALPHVHSARRQMEKMINHTGAHKRVAIPVEIDAPRIARAVGIDLEFPGARIKARHGRIHDHAVIVGILRVLYFGVREDAMGHVQQAIGSPGKAIEQLVPVLQAKTGHKNRLLIRQVIAIRILQKQKMRCLAHVHAAVAQQNAGREIQAVGKRLHFVSLPVAIGIFEDFDDVERLCSSRRPKWILIKLHHPEASTLVPGHRHRIDHIRFRREQPHLETGWNGEFLLRFGWGKGGSAGGSMLARQLPARRPEGPLAGQNAEPSQGQHQEGFHGRHLRKE